MGKVRRKPGLWEKVSGLESLNFRVRRVLDRRAVIQPESGVDENPV